MIKILTLTDDCKKIITEQFRLDYAGAKFMVLDGIINPDMEIDFKGYLGIYIDLMDCKTTLVGYIHITEYGYKMLSHSIFIFKGYRSKGYAEKSLEWLKWHTLEEQGCERILATILSENKSSIKLYEKLGFKYISSIPNTCLRNDILNDTLHYIWEDSEGCEG